MDDYKGFYKNKKEKKKDFYNEGTQDSDGLLLLLFL